MERKKPELSGDEIWVLEFTEESAQEFRNRLMEVSSEDPDKPIIIYIDSYGGSVDALAKMIATMDEIPNPLITACMGKAMSCGAILLSHGDVRFCDSHARIMIHRVSSVAYGDSDDIKNDAAEIERINRYWLGFLASNCNMPKGYDELDSFMKEKDGKDRYLNANEALNMDLIDVVGKPKLIQATVYEVISGPDKISIQKRAKLRSEHKEETRPKKAKPKKKKVRRNK